MSNVNKILPRIRTGDPPILESRDLPLDQIVPQKNLEKIPHTFKISATPII